MKTDECKFDKEVKRLNKPFYSAWLASRVLGVGLLLMTSAFLAICSLFVHLFPLKEIKPFLVSSYNKDSQVVKVEPLELNTDSLKKLMEIKCKEFVADLHTFDGQTESVRLKRLFLMAEEEVKDFIDNYLNSENSHSIAKKLQEAQVTRSVNVKHSNHLAPEAPNKWQVQWELLEVEKDGSQKRSSYISVITAEAKERKFYAGEDDINPIGFTVTQYKVRVVND